MRRIIVLLLSFTLALGSLFAGCSVETRLPENSVNSSESTDDASSSVKPTEKGFTVRLETSDGSKWDSLTGISAVWTEKSGESVCTASFNADGVAFSAEPDGEYEVSLTGVPSGYTYNPNAYQANNDLRETVIKLYPLRSLMGGDGGVSPDHFQIRQSGAYRFTFTKEADAFYFTFGGTGSSKVSLQSLIDVRTNEVSPLFYECFGTHLPTVRKEIIGGGASSTFTKNFYCAFNLTGSQDMLFKIGATVAKQELYPVVIDLLVEENEYEGEYSNLTVVPKPTLSLPKNLTEEYVNADGVKDWRAAKVHPRKNFLSVASMNYRNDKANNVFDERWVAFDEETGLYYLNKNHNKPELEPTPDKGYPLYAVLKRDVPGLSTTDLGGAHNLGLSYKPSYHLCTNSKKDYTEFISAYMERCTADGGAYPVDAALKEYLTDVSITRTIFFDGMGPAELGGKWGDFPEGKYSADSDSRWMFACGFYIQ